MNLKLTLALAASFAAFTSMAQENILDMRENYNIGQTVTVTGVVTSDDNLGSVRYLQDATAGIATLPRPRLVCVGRDPTDWRQLERDRGNHRIQRVVGSGPQPHGCGVLWRGHLA